MKRGLVEPLAFDQWIRRGTRRHSIGREPTLSFPDREPGRVAPIRRGVQRGPEIEA
jgi:hypothetical protein